MKSAIVNSLLRSDNPHLIIGISLIVGVGSAAYYLHKWGKENTQNPVEDDIKVEKETKKVKNILIVGRTGSGKSALANVLIGKGQKFKEVSGSTSGTQENQKVILELKRNKYQIIDTIGLGNVSKLPSDKAESSLKELAEEIEINGISHIFFVFKDRFTEEQVETFKWLKDNFHENELYSYITLVPTNFIGFESKERREEDKRKLLGLEENKNITEIIKKCKIIYVDNPPLEYGNLAKKRREKSRKILLNHLESSCKSLLPLSFKIDFSLNDLEEEINNVSGEQLESLVEVPTNERG